MSEPEVTTTRIRRYVLGAQGIGAGSMKAIALVAEVDGGYARRDSAPDGERGGLEEYGGLTSDEAAGGKGVDAGRVWGDDGISGADVGDRRGKDDGQGVATEAGGGCGADREVEHAGQRRGGDGCTGCQGGCRRRWESRARARRRRLRCQRQRCRRGG